MNTNLINICVKDKEPIENSYHKAKSNAQVSKDTFFFNLVWYFFKVMYTKLRAPAYTVESLIILVFVYFRPIIYF